MQLIPSNPPHGSGWTMRQASFGAAKAMEIQVNRAGWAARPAQPPRVLFPQNLGTETAKKKHVLTKNPRNKIPNFHFRRSNSETSRGLV